MRYFEIASRSKTNSDYSKIGVEMQKGKIKKTAIILNFRTVSIPFAYLGMCFNGNPQKHDFWQLVLNIL